jgi:hypothetical protein
VLNNIHKNKIKNKKNKSQFVLVKQNRKGNRGNKNPVTTHEKISRKVRRKNAFEQV